jgi:hypothetical protein
VVVYWLEEEEEGEVQVPGVLPSSSKLIPLKVGKGAVLETR